MTRTPQELEAAAWHVGYEALIMVQAAVRRNQPVADQAQANLLLEGTLLHCRNTIDFLGPWSHHRTTSSRATSSPAGTAACCRCRTPLAPPSTSTWLT